MEFGAYTPLARETLIIWAAGFLDGEGSFGMKRSPNGSVSLCIQADQVDPTPLFRLQELWGGALRAREARTERDAAYYHWFIWSQQVVRCCRDIQPFVTVKTAQVALSLEFNALGRKPSKHIGEQGRAENRAFYEMFKQLNRRGISKGIGSIQPKPHETSQLRLVEAI